MKRLKIGILAILLGIGSLYAQDVTVDEIIENYSENTGGKENWKNLKGIKMTMKLSAQGMELPIEVVNLADGRQYQKVTVQGNEIFQQVYDGEILWNTNFMNMSKEKSDAETTANFKPDLNDFPESLYDYKAKGYTAELVGTEIIEGTETYKVKLVKEQKTFNGTPTDDIVFYYFDMEAFVPIAQESLIPTGPQAGQMSFSTQSDFQEVDGLYFPFSMTQGIKGGPSQPITVVSIELNPEVDEAIFKLTE